MSDSIVMKRSCERCPAVQETPISVEDLASGKFKPAGSKDAPVKYEVKVEGKAIVSYKYLCTACEAMVKTAIENIAKTLEKKSSTRNSNKK